MDTYAAYRLKYPNKKTEPLLYSSAAVRTQGVVSDSQCVIEVLTGFNAGTEHRYLLLFEFDPPRADDVPAFAISVPSKAQLSWNPAQGGRVFSNCYWAISSAPGTYVPVAPGGPDGFWLDVEGLAL